ncbi:ANL family adenylate-forming protein [Paenibacillus sp. KN14-4R]|uniref:ANL family adenylate-forming protein n=1 Tax=Paenibacillus sp. KN14-4R TaxID=3445773 RepID=UPI003F9F65BB
MSDLRKWLNVVARYKCIVEFSDRSRHIKLPFFELFYQAEKIAGKLRINNKKNKAVCVLILDNNIDFLFSLLVSLISNFIPVMMPHYTSIREKIENIIFLEAEVVIVTSTFISYLIANNEYYFFNSWGVPTQTVYCFVKRQKVRRLLPHPETEVMFLTSGSIGKPKIIQLSVRNILSNFTAIQAYIKLEEKDRVLVTRSLGTASVMVGEVLPALASCSTIHFCENQPSILTLNESIKNYRPTFLCTVPAALYALASDDAIFKQGQLDLKKIVTVGAAISHSMLKKLTHNLSYVDIYPSYGLTEASPRVSFLPPNKIMSKIGSVGQPIEGVQVEIYSPAGESVKEDVIGEIVVKGPNVMLGYYGESDLTTEDRGLMTGDLGYKDREGFIYIEGRKDSAINVGGHTICPEHVEMIIESFPSIYECLIYGVSDQIFGHILHAEIIINEFFDMKIFKSYLSVSLRSHEQPRKIHFVEKLQKTTSGKKIRYSRSL